MIPQPFVKGAGERVYFGPYEYPSGADIVFDFGNPICTSAFNTSQIVYNAGTANVTGSLIAYNNPGPIYPTLSSTNGGVMITRAIALGSNYIQWDWKSTEQQSSVYLFALNGTQLNPWSSKLPQAAGASSIATTVNGTTAVTESANLSVDIYDSGNGLHNTYAETLNVDVSNGRNGYNLIGVTANASNSQTYYINQSGISGTESITRTTSGTQTTQFGVSSNMKIMAYLQYPKILTPKQIRQIYKVFSQRFFT